MTKFCRQEATPHGQKFHFLGVMNYGLLRKYHGDHDVLRTVPISESHCVWCTLRSTFTTLDSLKVAVVTHLRWKRMVWFLVSMRGDNKTQEKGDSSLIVAGTKIVMKIVPILKVYMTLYCALHSMKFTSPVFMLLCHLLFLLSLARCGIFVTMEDAGYTIENDNLAVWPFQNQYLGKGPTANALF